MSEREKHLELLRHLEALIEANKAIVEDSLKINDAAKGLVEESKASRTSRDKQRGK